MLLLLVCHCNHHQLIFASFSSCHALLDVCCSCCCHLCHSLCHQVFNDVCYCCLFFHQNYHCHQLIAASLLVCCCGHYWSIVYHCLPLFSVIFHQYATPLLLLAPIDCWDFRHFIAAVYCWHHAAMWLLHSMAILSPWLLVDSCCFFSKKGFFICSYCTTVDTIFIVCCIMLLPSYRLGACLVCMLWLSPVDCCFSFPTWVQHVIIVLAVIVGLWFQ